MFWASISLLVDGRWLSWPGNRHESLSENNFTESTGGGLANACILAASCALCWTVEDPSVIGIEPTEQCLAVRGCSTNGIRSVGLFRMILNNSNLWQMSGQEPCKGNDSNIDVQLGKLRKVL